jgi:hypothetical protein
MWTYSPSDVSITLAGKPIEGFSDGEFIRVTRESPLYTSKRAMDGTVAVTQQRYSKWTVVITLAQSSPSNNFLDGVQKILAEYNVAAMQWLPLIIKDNSGDTMFFAKDVWIEQVPEQVFGKDMSVREWTIVCNDVTSIIGGNSEDVDSVTEALQAVGVLLTAASTSRNIVQNIGRWL